MQLNDLQRQYAAYQPEIDRTMQRVVQSGNFTGGHEVEFLEQELSAYTGAKHSIACSSGTDALLLALLALDLQPGEEVIVPAFGPISQVNMVRLLSATPVFVDVSPIDFNIAIEKIEPKITSRTKAIIAVSLFGQCADIDTINTIAEKHGIWVIEDASQSFGAEVNGHKSGAITHLATTSFSPGKPLGAFGNAGAVFTSNNELAEKVRVLLNHGQTLRYHYKFIGLNARMDSLQAAVLRVKLKHLDEELQARNQVANHYKALLPEGLLLPEIVPGRKSSWSQFTVGLANRDAARTYLENKSIPTAVHYPMPLPQQESLADIAVPGEMFEVSELLSATVLSLPVHAFLQTNEIEYIAQTLNNFLSHEG
ncbi:MAG: DegT/DnrJ/EryC1/StrS family aminotransferase [Mangrovibacterium sp.]